MSSFYFSKYTMVTPLGHTGQYAVLSPLSGNFDLADDQEFNKLLDLKNNKINAINNSSFVDYLLERGYAFNSKDEENALLNKKYNDFQKEILRSQVQLLLIPAYTCNFNCIYCFQKDMNFTKNLIDTDTITAFFNFIKSYFKDVKLKPFITLFGGEPLINSPKHKGAIESIINNCADYNYELSVVTNGYEIINYIDILKKAKIKEIQITVDGTAELHDKRRVSHDGGSTFSQIMDGVQALIDERIPVNFRVVVDKENLEDLVNLAELVEQKGWLNLDEEFFKTQIGRNYELFDCCAKPEHLLSQLDLWKEYVNLANRSPVLKKFHKPQFKGVRHLVDTGEMYMPSFDTCPALKTEWVFDLKGDIYGCTASCGREELKVGTFSPDVKLFDQEIALWQNRNILNMKECADCASALTCGGGCGVIARNKNGSILAGDCRPTNELIELGINYYAEEILRAYP